MVANESEYPEYDKKDQEWEYFTVVVISRVSQEKERQQGTSRLSGVEEVSGWNVPKP